MSTLTDKFPHMKHVGYFFIGDDMFYTGQAFVKKIMGQVLVLDAEHHTPPPEPGAQQQPKGGVRYLAICHLFEVHDGPMIHAPYYEVVLSRQEKDGFNNAYIGGGWHVCVRKAKEVTTS